VTSAADQARYREVMGHFATGVAVVTARSGDGAVGMTTNALTSVSLDPLMLLVCFELDARTLPVVRDSRCFAVNVLRTGHDELSARFASKLSHEQKFERVDFHTEHGAPVLHEALAWTVCDLRELVPAGDHEIALGEVVAMGYGEGDPLVYYRGRYVSLAREN
jgi:3-hydroxy-9,10-secoandrosta-1,3,5(10)-triene-9,17-dione monooxygenase reductase component